MRLNSEEKAMQEGELGPVPQEAIRHQIQVGTFFGAKDFVPVTQAHIMADTESLGEHNVRWLEQLAAEKQGQHTVRIPTITDPRGTDFTKSKQLGQADWMVALERRAVAASVKLGV